MARLRDTRLSPFAAARTRSDRESCETQSVSLPLHVLLHWEMPALHRHSAFPVRRPPASTSVLVGCNGYTDIWKRITRACPVPMPTKGRELTGERRELS